MIKFYKTISSFIKINISFGIVIIIILLSNCKLVAQSNVDEYDVKKTLIFKITNFIDWPEKSKVNATNDPIIISIIGENPFKGKLKKLAENPNRKIKNKRITVRIIHSIDEIKNSDILFISSSERYDISKILKYTSNKPILTIGDTKGFVEKGVMIGLILRGEHILFYINKKEADKCGFYINSQLLGNAFKVF